MRPIYEPTEDEIKERADILRWMQEQKWDDALIIEIMIYDNPTIDKVKEIILKHGAERAYEILMKFLP